MNNTAALFSGLETTRMIPVFYHPDLDTAKGIVDACYRGGIRVFEFTNRGDAARHVFAGLVEHVRQYQDAFLGIGTIMDGATAGEFIDKGAHFIVSPVMLPQMAEVCRTKSTPWIPGCASLTEIWNARLHGADLIKLFPGNVIGASFVSAVMPVIPGLRLMPTGGVEPEISCLKSWFDAGVYCVGMGSQLLTKDVIGRRAWPELEDKVRQTLHDISQITNK